MDMSPVELFTLLINHLWVSVIATALGIIGYHGRWRKSRNLKPEDDGYIGSSRMSIFLDFIVEGLLIPHLMALVALILGSIGGLSNNMRLLVVIVATLQARDFLKIVVDSVGGVIGRILSFSTGPPGGK